MSRHTPRSQAYKRMCAQVKREEPLCWLCGKPIDPDLAYPHPRSFSLDHVIPVSQRPDLALVRTNARASHRVCNLKRGDRPPTPQSATPRTSRAW